jgi:uncharacterized pyridoxal phosphate-containing UPF0001 family protein
VEVEEVLAHLFLNFVEEVMEALVVEVEVWMIVLITRVMEGSELRVKGLMGMKDINSLVEEEEEQEADQIKNIKEEMDRSVLKQD